MQDDAEHFTVPWEPTEAMWGTESLARAIMMWLDFSPHTPRTLFDHLRRSGHDIPDWLRNDAEMKVLDHTPSKGTRCVIIYKAMLMDCRREGLRKLTAMGEEMEALTQPRNPT